jgi:hypothetical protein
LVELNLTTQDQRSNEIENSAELGKTSLNLSRFNMLQAELARLRPDLTPQDIATLVSEKKSKVGGGFLTDQGALFLVASDLGVTLRHMLTNSQILSNEPSERNESILEARILTMGPPKLLQNRVASSFVLKLVGYNETSTIFLNIWDYATASKFLKSDSGPGDAIQVRDAFSKRPSATSSDLFLSVSNRGEIIKTNDGHSMAKHIPTISDRTLDLMKLRTVPMGMSTIVNAKISSAVRIGEFRKKDETTSRYVSFNLDDNGLSAKTTNFETRVVIWDNSNPVFDKLRLGESVTLLNVKPKITEYLGQKNLELHGDETCGILEHWNETKAWIEGRLGLVATEIQKSNSLTHENGNVQRISPFIARILSIGDLLGEKRDTHSSAYFLLIDSSKRKIVLNVQGEALEDIAALKIDDVVVCRPTSFDKDILKAICQKKESILKVRPQRNDIPRSVTLVSEISKLEPNSIASIDCMVLSITPSRDIETKEGLAKRSEILVADPSGEIKVYAWRGLSKHLDRLSPGDRIWLRACEIQSHEGKKFALFKNYSWVEYQKN